jgi:SAM-dependent methyltransferase
VSLAEHPDRIRWNGKYGRGYVASFVPHPLAAEALAMGLPDGPVADLACGASGSALLAAGGGRKVTAVDISEIALRLLDGEARRRGLSDLITVRHADLGRLHLPPRHYALVLCAGFWDSGVFAAAAESVAPGGLLAWEAFTVEALRARAGLCADWCLAPGEPASLLPPGFEVVDVRDLPAPALSPEPGRALCAAPCRPRRHNERGTKRRLLARRVTVPGPGNG